MIYLHRLAYPTPDAKVLAVSEHNTYVAQRTLAVQHRPPPAILKRPKWRCFTSKGFAFFLRIFALRRAKSKQQPRFSRARHGLLYLFSRIIFTHADPDLIEPTQSIFWFIVSKSYVSRIELHHDIIFSFPTCVSSDCGCCDHYPYAHAMGIEWTGNYPSPQF